MSCFFRWKTKKKWWSVRLNAITNEFVSIITESITSNTNIMKKKPQKTKWSSWFWKKQNVNSIPLLLNCRSVITIQVQIEFSKPQWRKGKKPVYELAHTNTHITCNQPFFLMNAHTSQKQWIWKIGTFRWKWSQLWNIYRCLRLTQKPVLFLHSTQPIPGWLAGWCAILQLFLLSTKCFEKKEHICTF